MEYTEDMFTEWFDLKDTKPTKAGVYELQGGLLFTCFAYWDGASFSYAWRSNFYDAIEKAFSVKHRKAQTTWFSSMTKWRGLKQNQAATKKKPSGNKKKTMWIVSAWVNGGETYKHVGAFENHDNAVNAAKRYKQPRINKVRFRTPEA